MWFRRDLRLGDNPALLEAAADGDVLPLFVLDPALWGPAGPARRAHLGASLRALDASLRAAAGVAVGGPRRSGTPRGARRARGRRHPGPRRRRLRPLRPPPRPGGRAGPRRARDRAGPHRLAVRRRAGPGHQRVRRPLQGLHAVLEGLGRPRLARPGRTPPTGRLLAGASTTPPTSPTRRCPTGSTLPEAGERAAARRRWRSSSTSASATTTPTATGPGVDGTSRMSVHLKWGEIHPRTMLADLARLRSAGRRDLPQGAGLAGVLRRRAVRPPRDGARVPAPGVRADAVRRARRPARGVAAGPHRLPDRRRRHAPAAGDRLDAQPGADDRGQLPGQGPAPRVAARRPALHALAGRRRPRLQPARLAVDGRLRHRRGAVLPGLQPDQPGPQVRPGRRLRPALGAGAGRRPTTRTSPTTAAAPGAGYPAPVVDHAEERREALDRWERIRDDHDPARPARAPPLLRTAVLGQRRLDRRRARRADRRTTAPTTGPGPGRRSGSRCASRRRWTPR